MNNKRKGLLLGLGAALTVASIGIGALSLAVFTDTETDASTFTAGTIILDATKIAALDLTNAALMPGAVVNGSVDVENDGSAQLRYSLNTTSTSVAGPNGGVLNSALTITVRGVDVDAVGCGSFDGTLLNTAAEVLGASNVMFGDPSPTVGTGDITVAAGATHVLCLRVSLPIGTGDTYQGAAATTTFTFNAEQTANN